MKDSDELQRAFGFLWPVEPAVLKHLASLLPPSPVVINIGAGVGTSAMAFLEARDDLEVYTLDIQDTAHPLGGLENERTVLTEAGLYPSGRHHQVLGDSAGSGLNWKHPPVDLVFVDGDHSTEGVLRDVDAWYPHLRDGGIMAFHDVGDRWLFDDVGKALAQRAALFDGLVCRISLIAAYWKPLPVSVKPFDRVEAPTFIGQPMTFVASYPNMGGWLAQAEPETWEWAKRAIRQDWVCVDAGAHAGMYTLLFSQKASKGRVYAIEANPDAAQMLRTNVAYNARFNYRSPANIRLSQVAIGDRTGRFATRVWLTGRDPSDEERVFVRLEEWGASLPRLDLLKTDVDGWDYDALVGAEGLIRRFKPIVLSEINYALAWRGHTEAQADALIRSWGYEHRVLDRENWLCWPADEPEKAALCRP